uniref:AAR2 C-terminal domain-containing protein n=1 Tax=Vitis vinifera TaxID=29760 RepID=A5B9E1_VITVI|nr:hypothetical protein VITISV_037337 [Vitis vinifera]
MESDWKLNMMKKLHSFFLKEHITEDNQIWRCVPALMYLLSLLFIRVIYYQLKFGFQKDQTGSSNVEKESSLLLDESWLSADSFLHHLCKDFFSLVQEASVVDGDLLSWMCFEIETWINGPLTIGVEKAFSFGLSLVTRKLRDLLENTLGWDFQQTSTVDGLYCEEDEVSITFHHSGSMPTLYLSLLNALSIQFAPVVEMLEDPSEQ